MKARVVQGLGFKDRVFRIANYNPSYVSCPGNYKVVV